MVISAFVLGIFAAIVVIEIAAIIVIMLKMAGMEKLREDIRKLKGEIEKIEKGIAEVDEALIREINSNQETVGRENERVMRDAVANSKSYTDFRIDKLTESIKK